MAKVIKDEDGKVIKHGDTISFAYGIPPVCVRAKVEDRDGTLWIVVPPPHKPSTERLSKVKKWYNIYLEERA